MFNEDQISLLFNEEFTLKVNIIIHKDIIIDRKSKYTLVAWKVSSKEEIKIFIKNLLKDEYFKKATHNSYAYRIKLENNSILEWKNDDGENW
jgi:putative IMPACT (imprinted ancient) family translation regulator